MPHVVSSYWQMENFIDKRVNEGYRILHTACEISTGKCIQYMQKEIPKQVPQRINIICA